MNDTFERLLVLWWPILSQLWLEGNPPILLHFLRQSFNHVLLLEDRAVQTVHVSLHRRVDHLLILTLAFAHVLTIYVNDLS